MERGKSWRIKLCKKGDIYKYIHINTFLSLTILIREERYLMSSRHRQGEDEGVSVEVENLVTELMENLDQFVLDPAPQVKL